MLRLLLAVVVIATPALAQVPRTPSPDLDHDGKVTLQEFRKAGPGGRMARLDADKDGRISRREFDVMAERMAASGRAGAQARSAAIWSALDADKDGFVSKAEREAGQIRRFQAADTNRDGWLSKGELLMMRQNRARGG